MAIGKPLLVTERQGVAQPVLTPQTQQLSSNVPVQKIALADYNIGMQNVKSSFAVSDELVNMVEAGVKAKLFIDNTQREYQRLNLMEDWQKSDIAYKAEFAQAITPDDQQRVIADYDMSLQQHTSAWHKSMGKDIESEKYLSSLRVNSQKQFSTFSTTHSQNLHKRTVSMHEVGIASILKSMEEDRSTDVESSMNKLQDHYGKLLELGQFSPEETQFKFGLARQKAIIGRTTLFAKELATETAISGVRSYSGQELRIRIEQVLGVDTNTLDAELAHIAEETYVETYYKTLGEQQNQITHDENYKKYLGRQMYHTYDSDKKQILASGSVSEVDAQNLQATAKALEASGYPGEVAQLNADLNNLKYDPINSTVVSYFKDGEGLDILLNATSNQDSSYLMLEKVDEVITDAYPQVNLKTRNAIKNNIIQWNTDLVKNLAKNNQRVLRSELSTLFLTNPALKTLLESNVGGYNALRELNNAKSLNWENAFSLDRYMSDAFSRVKTTIGEYVKNERGPFAKKAMSGNSDQRQAGLRAFIGMVVDEEFSKAVTEKATQSMETGVISAHKSLGTKPLKRNNQNPASPQKKLQFSDKQQEFVKKQDQLLSEQEKAEAPYTIVSPSGLTTSQEGGQIIDVSERGAMGKAVREGALQEVQSLTQGLSEDYNTLKGVGRVVQQGLKNMIRSTGVKQGAQDLKIAIQESETTPEALNRLATQGLQKLSEPTGAQSPVSEAGQKLAGEPPKPVLAPLGTPTERYEAFNWAEQASVASTKQLLAGMEDYEQEVQEIDEPYVPQMTREESAEKSVNYLKNIGQEAPQAQEPTMIPQAPVTIPPNIVETLQPVIQQVQELVQPPTVVAPDVGMSEQARKQRDEANLAFLESTPGYKKHMLLQKLKNPKPAEHKQASSQPLDLTLPMAKQRDRTIWDRAMHLYESDKEFKEWGTGRAHTWEEGEELDLLVKEIERRGLNQRQMLGKGLWEPVDTSKFHKGDMFTFLAKNYNASAKLLKSETEEKNFTTNAEASLDNYYSDNLSPEQKTNAEAMLSVLDKAKWAFEGDLGYLGMSYEMFTNYMLAVYGAETQFGTDTPVSSRDVVGELQVTRGTFEDVTKPKGNLGPKMAEAMGYTVPNLRKLAKNDKKLRYSLLNSKEFNYLAGAAIVLNKLQYNPVIQNRANK